MNSGRGDRSFRASVTTESDERDRSLAGPVIVGHDPEWWFGAALDFNYRGLFSPVFNGRKDVSQEATHAQDQRASA